MNTIPSSIHVDHPFVLPITAQCLHKFSPHYFQLLYTCFFHAYTDSLHINLNYWQVFDSGSGIVDTAQLLLILFIILIIGRYCSGTCMTMQP